jgi:hypothetical protein
MGWMSAVAVAIAVEEEEAEEIVRGEGCVGGFEPELNDRESKEGVEDLERWTWRKVQLLRIEWLYGRSLGNFE